MCECEWWSLHKTDASVKSHLKANFTFCADLNTKEQPPYDSFVCILRNSNPLKKNCNDFENLVTGSLSTEQSIVNLRTENVPPTGVKNYVCLQTVYVNEQMQPCADFFKWYNNKDAVPTLEEL